MQRRATAVPTPMTGAHEIAAMARSLIQDDKPLSAHVAVGDVAPVPDAAGAIVVIEAKGPWQPRRARRGRLAQRNMVAA